MLEGMTPPEKKHGSCKVGTLASTLTEEDKKILFDAIEDQERWSIRSLIAALSSRGIIISDSPLYNHRAKSCACFRA